MIVRLLNSFSTRAPRPRARAWKRFITRARPTVADDTYRRSTSSWWLFSAFAIAACSTFFTSPAMRRLEKVSSATARLASMFRMSWATRLSFRGLVRIIGLRARASFSATRLGLAGLPMAYFLFAFLSAAWP